MNMTKRTLRELLKVPNIVLMVDGYMVARRTLNRYDIFVHWFDGSGLHYDATYYLDEYPPNELTIHTMERIQ
jgi:hypothetical protein